MSKMKEYNSLNQYLNLESRSVSCNDLAADSGFCLRYQIRITKARNELGLAPSGSRFTNDKLSLSGIGIDSGV